MPVFVALLHAVNVGGRSKILMADLRSMAETLGFRDVSTYIQSGNLIFRTTMGRDEASEKLNTALAEYFGQSPGLVLRTPSELETLCENMPFPEAAPNLLLITFFDRPVANDALENTNAPDGEEIVALKQEIIVHYANGSGRSKLKLPVLKQGTARNLNTVRKLAELTSSLAAAIGPDSSAS